MYSSVPSSWECSVSSCRQTGNGSRSPTLSLGGGYYQELMNQYEPARATMSQHELLWASMSYYEPVWIVIDTYAPGTTDVLWSFKSMCCYVRTFWCWCNLIPRGLLNPPFVAHPINVEQATNSQVRRGTSGPPYFATIVCSWVDRCSPLAFLFSFSNRYCNSGNLLRFIESTVATHTPAKL